MEDLLNPPEDADKEGFCLQWFIQSTPTFCLEFFKDEIIYRNCKLRVLFLNFCVCNNKKLVFSISYLVNVNDFVNKDVTPSTILKLYCIFTVLIYISPWLYLTFNIFNLH